MRGLLKRTVLAMALAMIPVHPSAGVERAAEAVTIEQRAPEVRRAGRRNRLNRKLRAAISKRINAAKRLPLFGKVKAPRRAPISEEQKIIGRMTNWQRNRWARAGYPMTLDILQDYAEMRRQKPLSFYLGTP